MRNNREFESLSKEIEFQELEIKLHDKKSKEAKYKIDLKKETLLEAVERVEMKQGDLDGKKAELEAIVSETQKDEEKLIKASDAAKKNIDGRLVFSYEPFRTHPKKGHSFFQVISANKKQEKKTKTF